MQVHIYETPELAAKAAAALIAAAILDKPNMVLGLPTGSSPVNTYKELARMNREGVVDFSRVITYNLDEYVGLEGTHEQSYRYFMNANLFDHVNIDKANTHVPCGVGDDPEKNARDYEAAIEKAGGIDLQFMGIGRNGHIGFNEPADTFVYGCHIVNLTQSTIEANRRFFESENDVPRQAISLGIGGIMNARRIILLATGRGKAQAVRDAVQGDITPLLPASILKAHRNVQFLLDAEAASLL